MTISIVNVSSLTFGWNDFELRHEGRIIASFRHKIEDGIAVCLERAAKAATEAHDRKYFCVLNRRSTDRLED